MPRSAVLDDYVLKRNGHVVAVVGGLLKQVEDFLEFDNLDCVLLITKQIADCPANFDVDLFFDSTDLDTILNDIPIVLQGVESVVERFYTRAYISDNFNRDRRNRLDLIRDNPVRQVFDAVDTSSSRVASEWISSASIGVMNV